MERRRRTWGDGGPGEAGSKTRGGLSEASPSRQLSPLVRRQGLTGAQEEHNTRKPHTGSSEQPRVLP